MMAEQDVVIAKDAKLSPEMVKLAEADVGNGTA